MKTRTLAAHSALLALVIACSGSDASPAGTTARMDFSRPDFWSAPFPSDDLRFADGRVRLTGFPNPAENLLVPQLLEMVERDARGFAVSGGVFVSFTDDLDPASLPGLAESAAPGASVYLAAVSDGAPDLGVRVPLWVSFDADGGPFGAPHLLTALPLSGIVLRPRETYALVVTRAVRDASGAHVGPSPEMVALARGATPTSMLPSVAARYRAALGALVAKGEDAANVAALAVFTTDDPTDGLRVAARAALTRPLPALTSAPVKGETFDGYCVYNAQIAMPDYQAGEPPYTKSGGGLALAADGSPILQRLAPSRVVLTVPRGPMPSAGYPVATLVRTGAGGDRPLVDRGVQATNGGPPIVAGSGPAQELARAGFAGAQVDGPHGGPRNVTNDDEQFLMFNVSNGLALRDNVRESALELAVFQAWLASVSFDASDCPGGPRAHVRFDVTTSALLGHSMGATIAPLALALAPTWKGTVLGGAGGSYIENVMWKEKPLVVRPLMETLFGYGGLRRKLTRGDPVLTLLQWAVEPADPLVYARSLVTEPPAGEAPRQVLMLQGIVDHYIMPPISNALALSLGLDLAGTELDTTNAELVARPELTPLGAVLPFAGRRAVPLPVSANARPGVTAVVVQHASDGVEDGHEIMFQVEAAKAEYRCFLASLVPRGAARVPDGACP